MNNLENKIKEVELLNPIISLIANKIQEKARVKVHYQKPSTEWITIKEPQGYLEQAGTYPSPIPEKTSCEYLMKIKNTSEMQRLLKDIGIINEEYAIYKPKASLYLEHRGKIDLNELKENSNARLTFQIGNRKQKNVFLNFEAKFSLNEGKVTNERVNVGCIDYKKSNFFGKKYAYLTLIKSDFKGFNKNLDENILYEVDFFKKINDIL